MAVISSLVVCATAEQVSEANVVPSLKRMLCRAQTQAALGRALVGQRRWSEARDQLDAAMKAAPGRRHPLDWLRHAQACEQMALESDGTPALLSSFIHPVLHLILFCPRVHSC